MKFKKPNFWDLSKPNLIAYLLLPFTLLIAVSNFILNNKTKKNLKILKQFVLVIFMLVGQKKHQLQLGYINY